MDLHDGMELTDREQRTRLKKNPSKTAMEARAPLKFLKQPGQKVASRREEGILRTSWTRALHRMQNPSVFAVHKFTMYSTYDQPLRYAICSNQRHIHRE